MSGGRLDYIHHRLHDAYDEIDKYLDNYDDDLASETKAEIKRGMRYIKLAEVYSYCIDMLMSQDYDEEDMRETITNFVNADNKKMRKEYSLDVANERASFLEDLIDGLLNERKKVVVRQKEALLNRMECCLAKILADLGTLDLDVITKITDELRKRLEYGE